MDELPYGVLIDCLGGSDVLGDLVLYGRAHEMRDAFGRAFFSLDSKVLRVGFVTCFVARLLGLDGVCFSAGSYCGGGGITKNCVVRDALGGFDGCQGVVPARR